jgi:hypothetical protein
LPELYTEAKAYMFLKATRSIRHIKRIAGKKNKEDKYSQSQQGNKQINNQIKKDSLKNGTLH